MFNLATKPTPRAMARQLNLPETPHLPDESMPTPTYEQPGDRAIQNYKKIVFSIASLAVVGTVAALALYNPNASTSNASVGAAALGRPDLSNEAPPQHPELPAELDRLASQNAATTTVPYLRAGAPDATAVGVPYLVGSAGTWEDRPTLQGAALEREVEQLLQAKSKAKSVDTLNGPPSHGKLLERQQAKTQSHDSIAVPYLVISADSYDDTHAVLAKELELLKAKHNVKGLHEGQPAKDKLLHLLLAKKQHYDGAADVVDIAQVDQDGAVVVPYLSENSDDHVPLTILGDKSVATAQSVKEKLVKVKVNNAKASVGSQQRRNRLELLNADVVAKLSGDEVFDEGIHDRLEKLLVLLDARNKDQAKVIID
ncbi:hypothetical protein DYB34_004504 [Aphanomyces astaci]|uniref:Uncharacterized protein n=1 Tax=Aphanomyces astaci TaxID=112090 RepID=A0A3R6VWX2_APHAT|nr:hypothetical protein DYB34_004504 [Aphanomyces astaci]